MFMLRLGLAIWFKINNADMNFEGFQIVHHINYTLNGITVVVFFIFIL